MFQKKQSILVLFVCLVILATGRQFRNLQAASNLLDPAELQGQMFQRQITGAPNVLVPSRVQKNCQGKITMEEYRIKMVKTTQRILPSPKFGETTIYAYKGKVKGGFTYAGFPGPAIVATKDRLTKVKWTNNIQGPHILPVDLNYPFESGPAFQFQVPVVPHAHGIATTAASDGLPQAYWTSTGIKGPQYKTQKSTSENSAVFYYPNQQDAGNYFYHDHAYGITRLNVYAGLAGLYKIAASPNSKNEKYIIDKYGSTVRQSKTKFLVITDKSFTTGGQLFYGGQVENPNFTSWLPEFFGNTMLVNGVLWPKMTLKNKKYRFVLLNACTSRFLNIWFDNAGQKIPFDLIRVDGSFYSSPVTKTQLLATISSRIQLILDLTNVRGEIILKNNAPSPFPMGDSQNFNPKFTGQIMKFIVQATLPIVPPTSVAPPKKAVKYPAFSQGERVFMTLFEVKSTDGNDNVEAAFIDGLSMMNSADCPNSKFQSGKTYDFYLINLTPDAHPMHIHLINFQKVKQFPFNVDQYKKDYFGINGVPGRYGFMTAPINIDPDQAIYRTGPDQMPGDQERVFRDTVEAHPEYVTVLRVKFARNDGKPFKSFNTSGQRYVMHCHILQHQDNMMMKYFCLK